MKNVLRDFYFDSNPFKNVDFPFVQVSRLAADQSTHTFVFPFLTLFMVSHEHPAILRLVPARVWRSESKAGG